MVSQIDATGTLTNPVKPWLVRAVWPMAWLVALGATLERALHGYVRFSIRRAWWVLGCAALVAGLGAFGAAHLRVNPRLEALLPRDTPAARSLKELESRLQSSSPLYLVVQSSDLELSRAMAERLRAEVAAWEETQWVMTRRDPSYFLDGRLLYLEAADLDELNEQIDERRRWEECQRIPGCVNLDDETPPLPSDEDLQQLFEKNPDVRALVSLFGNDASQFAEAKPRAKRDPSAKTPTGDTDEHLGELCDPETKVCSVQASLRGDASNLEFASEILARSEALFEQLERDAVATDLKFAVSGQFRNVPMTQRAVARDLAKTTFLSVALMLFVVLLQFRGLRCLVLLFVPVAAGILWTAGGIGMVRPSLNLISAFTLAVLAGVGIDFGIHLLTHYAKARNNRETPEAALQETFRALAPSLFVAAFTTASGFAALAVASFRGFAEMGPIAASGVLVSFLAFLLLFPALIAVLDRQATTPFALRSVRLPVFGFLQRRSLPVATLGLLLTAGCGAVGVGWIGEGVSFEYNFRNLRPKNVAHGIPWAKTLHGTTRTAVYLLADDRQSLAEVAKVFRKQPPEGVVDSTKPFLIVPAAFIPPDQTPRLRAVARLKQTLERAKPNASSVLKEKIDTFAPLTHVTEPIRAEEMPRWVSEWLTERDGTFGTLGILYTRLSGSDARHMELLARRMDAWRERFPKVRFASPVAQLGEVTPRLRAEAPSILAWALLGVLVGTLVIGRSLWRSLAVLFPLLVMVSLALAFMAIFEIRVNLYNMLVFPLAFGIGVDGAVYVNWAFASRAPTVQLPSAARAVLGSTLTSVAGFGSLMISDNPGLASIGLLTTILLGASLIANLLWLPALHWSLDQRSSRH